MIHWGAGSIRQLGTAEFKTDINDSISVKEIESELNDGIEHAGSWLREQLEMASS